MQFLCLKAHEVKNSRLRRGSKFGTNVKIAQGKSGDIIGGGSGQVKTNWRKYLYILGTVKNVLLKIVFRVIIDYTVFEVIEF